jgi:hypothetical protein
LNKSAKRLLVKYHFIPIVIKICAYVISTEAPVSSVEDRNRGVAEKSVQIDFSTRLRLARNDGW